MPLITYKVVGDQTEAVKWRKRGRLIAERLLASALPATTQQVTSNVLIKATADGDDRATVLIIILDGVYLESGFFDHLSIAPLNASAYLPSFLHYGAEQIADYANAKPVQGYLSWTPQGHAQGEKLDERTSKAITNNKALSKTDLNGQVSPTPIYGNADMLKRKQAQSKVQPSLYPGLMALYVQVLYGKLPCQYDFATMADSAASYPALVLKVPSNSPNTDTESLTLPHTGVASTWLMTTGDWNYYLVIANATGLTLRKLGCQGTKPKGTLTALEQRQAHAGRLASSAPSKNTLSLSFGQTVQGEPIAYGWKPDATGQNAKIVTHTDDGTIRTSRTYSITINLSNFVPTSASLSLDEQADWDITAGRHAVWFPDDATGMEKALAPVADFIDWGPVECSAAIYQRTYADTIRISGAATLYGDYTLGDQSVTPVAAYAIPDQLNYTVVEIIEQGSLSPSDPTNYYTPNPGNNYMSNGNDLSWYAPALFGRDWVSEPPDYYGPPIDSYLYRKSQIGRRDDYLGRTSATDGQVCLVIAADDCQAIAAGTRTSVTIAYGSSHTGYFGGTREYLGGLFRFISDGGGAPAYWHFVGLTWQSDTAGGDNIVPMGFGDVSGYNPAYTPTGVWEYEGGSATTNNASLKLKVSDASIDLYTDPTDANLQKYFTPEIGPTGNPYINPAYAFESVGGSYRYQFPYSEAGSSNWPANTPVGWA